MSSDLVTLAPDRLDAQATQFAGWLAGGTADLYTAPRRAAVTDPIGDAVLLGSIPFDDPCATVSDGICTVDPLPESVVALADGTPTWSAMRDSLGAEIGDMSVGADGSGEAVELLNTSLVAGGLIIPTSIAFVFGG